MESLPGGRTVLPAGWPDDLGRLAARRAAGIQWRHGKLRRGQPEVTHGCGRYVVTAITPGVA